MQRNNIRSNKSLKNPKYSAPKPTCEGCKKNACYNNRTLPSKTNNEKTHPRTSILKLFSIIESFHNNLCSLPLNILLANQKQDQWLNEQYQTLGSLSAKLESFSENPQTDYYKAKIQSVKLVLQNIQTNLETLGNLNYASINSGRSSQNCNSYKSRNTQSIRESRQRLGNHCWQQLLADSSSQKGQSELPNSKQNIRDFNNIGESQRVFKKTEALKPRYSQIIPQKLLKDGLSTNYQTQQRTVLSKQKVYEKSLYEIKEDEKRQEYQRLCEQNLEAYRKNLIALKSNAKIPSEELTCLKTYKSEISEQSQENSSACSPQQKTKRMKLNSENFTAISSKQKESILENNSTKLFNLNTANKAENKLMVTIEQMTVKIHQLQSQLAELQDQVSDKNKQIQSILVNNQQLQAVVEVFKTERIATQQSAKYSLERINNLSQNNENLQIELAQWKAREKDLRITITQHQKHIAELQQINLQLNEQVKNQTMSMRQIREEIKSLNLKVQEARKRQSIALEQLAIYKNRNKQLISQNQLNRLIEKESYAGKNQKVRQLRDIMLQHRLNLEMNHSVNPNSDSDLGLSDIRNGRSISHSTNN